MLGIIAGLALWSGAHFFKRLAPARRAGLGDKGRGLVAVVSVLGIVLMVLGYRASAFIPVWHPPAAFTGINNLLMLAVFYLFGVGAAKGALSARLRHPQLTAVILWAVAHLLVNGDLAAILLFGGMLAWAVMQIAIINRSQPWDRPSEVSLRGDLKAGVIGVVLMALVAGVHAWLGVNPFG
ncbi:NnrU family protein [Jannaschia sp. 2305UL9-9]|uniref:NnrU family protein n=1 Tax=Jannaschia sp. 2305UL9-9 TaxID=3121638 RepID=UPI003527601D